ncbi:hypothetical protein ACOQFV_23135 [Nocardiopsis changdeensis]|uniref:Uncharacterized protein n=1 Tax=Nocardiopsis changdeensis TaxID=2831969 RepID=A0ABX8BIN0_9ACTN|nr:MULTISPECIES: hypothetical protein [Nocardiopsis]QUX21924.1 hypothetical protein KGD84_26730 [Nocardiopsis changdeensis]QYX37860.1 hypothetical protein K1J57_04125 [Nocardiopsis sp. MT53]
MPSYQHEFPLDLIRNDPESAVELLQEIAGESLPEFTRVRCDAAEATSTAMTHLTSDSVVVCERPPYPHEKGDDPVPVLAVIVEPQNKRDDRKYYRWPAYVANTRMRLECPVALLVLTPTSSLARHFAEPIDLGCGEIRPLVLALDTLRPITDTKTAAARPMLTILSLANNPPKGEDEAVLSALNAALRSLDGSSTSLYSDYVLAALKATAPGILETLMKLKDYEFKTEFVGRLFREGETKGKAGAVLTVLEARGVEVSEEARQRIERETDRDQLDIWLNRAARAERAEDVFGEGR